MACQWERRNVRESKINLKENEKKWPRMKTMSKRERNKKKQESKKI